jgi:hypothetical protein
MTAAMGLALFVGILALFYARGWLREEKPEAELAAERKIQTRLDHICTRC